jgi:hypothetical protein
MGFGSESRSLSEEIVQKEVAARGKTLVVPFTYWDYANSKRIETGAQSRSVMLLKRSGLHAHYTDSANELLRVPTRSLGRRVRGIF